jgi:5-methylcytosine-specific restriction endonuclease McrA
MGEILDYLNAKEIDKGQKYVREECRRYMLKKTFAGQIPTVRKSIPKKWTLDAWEKQDGICPRCKQPIGHNEMSGDHKTPIALGGAHNKWNVECLHKKCNSSKNANDFIRESKLAQTGQTLHVNEDERITREPVNDEL